VYTCNSRYSGWRGGGHRRGRAQVVYTRTLLAAIPLPLFLSCFLFSFTSIQMVFVYCIVFLELLPSTDGVRASSVESVRLHSSYIPPSPTNAFSRICRLAGVIPSNHHTDSLLSIHAIIKAVCLTRSVCRVFSNTPRVRTASLEVTQQHGII
jgi:hypothetical protein